MPKISALPEMNTPDGGDYIPIVDTSEQTTKKISASNIFGINNGWVSAGEEWTYVSYSATTRIAVFTVASGADLRYTAKNRVRFEQSPDGVKFGIIVMVETTTLHVFMHESYDVDNADITDNYYSLMDSPLGFDSNPDKWTLELSDDTDRTYNASPVGGTWYNLAALVLTIGAGVWDTEYWICMSHNRTAGGTGAAHLTTLSTTTNSETDSNWTRGQVTSGVGITQYKPRGETYARNIITLTEEDTFNLLGAAQQTGTNLLVTATSYHPTIIRARCAYL